MTLRTDDAPIVAAVYVLALFITLLDLTITNVALPTLAGVYRVAPSAIAWVATAYLLSVAVCIPISGWLGDRFGTKRTFLVALVAFTAGSLLCGLAWNVGSLIGFRVLQGIGGGLLTPVGAAMVLRAFPLAERARIASLITVPAVAAPALGPVVGGYLVEAQPWRWIFLINVPLALIGLFVAARYLAEHRVEGAGPLDVAGFVLAAAGLAGAVYALGEAGDHGLADAQVLGFGAAAMALAAFVRVELTSPYPMIDLRIFRHRLFAAGNAVLFFVQAGFFGVVFLLPLLLQAERGLSPLASGLTTFATALGIMAVSPVAGRLYGRIGPRRLVMAGTTLAVLVALALRAVDLETSLWAIRALMLPMGIAFGLVFIPVQAASFAGIAASATGRATAAYSAVRQITTSFGLALLAGVLSSRFAEHGAVLGNPATRAGALAAFHDAFAVAALVNLLALGAALLISDRLAAPTMQARAAGLRSDRPAAFAASPE